MHTRILLSFILCSACLTASDSPAQLRIADARKVIDKGPKSSQAFDDLAAAYLRRARETGDPSYLEKADEAVRQSLQITPADYEAKKLRTAILLGRRNYAEALKLATAVNKQVPDDLAGWGLLADANTALGNYEDAEKDVQWMLDLRPGNVPAFVKAAALREVFGDPEGALEFYDEALRRTPPTETEERAWLLTQKARVNLKAGSPKRAADQLQEALTLYPDYHLALVGLGAVRMQEKNYMEAARLFERRSQVAGDAAGLYDWAEALERSGRKEEAEAVFQKFAARAQTEPELVFYYADRRSDPAKAVAVAEQAYALRHDVRTLDAYAWALYRNGKAGEAKKQIEKALAVGAREPVYLCHAAAIEAKAGDCPTP